MEYKRKTIEDDLKDIGRCKTDPDCRMKKKKLDNKALIKKYGGPRGDWNLEVQ